MTQIQTKQSILKLIKEAENVFAGTGKALLDIEDYVAEYLTANGVIAPPCKVGDLLYMPWEYGGTKGVACLYVAYMVIDKNEIRIMTDFSTDDEDYYDLYNGGKFTLSDFGKSVFRTREDAEKALNERANNG